MFSPVQLEIYMRPLGKVNWRSAVKSISDLIGDISHSEIMDQSK